MNELRGVSVITALDTPVLLGLLIPDPGFVDASQRTLEAALSRGALAMWEVVYPELAS